MNDRPPESALDQLAAELSREVRKAVAARAGAELAAALDGMTRGVDEAAAEIEQLVTVLKGPSPLEPPQGYAADLGPRTEWVNTQIEKVRAKLDGDPMQVRQGKLWAETQRAFSTLRAELAEILDSSYKTLIDSFVADDLQVLDTLPPGTPGAHEYRLAIDAFDQLADKRPASPEDVTKAAAAGRRLQALRDRVETEAVPARFQADFRLVRTSGLPLASLTDEFAEWLRERGLDSSTVLLYRAR